MSPRLLDLFCGAGGAAMGYWRAGFDVVGVDIEPQPHYPFEFVQADALDVLRCKPWAMRFDAYHASPPCQAYAGLAAKDGRHPRLIEPVRDLLKATGATPYVIENIVGAPLRTTVMLCGSMFGLNVRRHRLFETSDLILGSPRCAHDTQDELRAYYGKKGRLVWQGRRPLLRGSVEQAPADMGIDWMTWNELREAIPPAYTEYIGAQLLAHLGVAA
jgi:DNA (cytosine-5)-methyltransferase 1